VQDLLNPTAFLNSVRRRWWMPLLFVALAAGVSHGITRRLPKIYRASTLILVEPQKIPVAYVRPTVTTSVENRLRSIQQQITSRSRIERVIQELNLFPDQTGRVPMERLVAQVAPRVSIQTMGTSAFRIHFEGTNPQTVAQVANKLADLFIAENTEAREREARTTSEFLEEELQKVKERLEAEEEAIARFKREHMGELPEQRESNLRTLETLQARLRLTSEALTRAQDRRLTLESQLADLPSTGADANQVALLLDQARARLSQLKIQYTDQHPEVLQQQREIARLERALEEQPPPDPNAAARPAVSVYEARLKADLEAAETDIKTLTKEEAQIRADIVKYQLRVENAPRNEAALSTLTRDYDNLRANYQSLLSKKLEAKLAENLERERQGEQFTIVDRAVPPVAPYKPNLTQIMMLGSAIGLLAGCAAAFAVDLLRPRFRTEEELAAAFGVPVLAVIPKVAAAARPRRPRGLLGLRGPAGTVVLLAAAARAALEALRPW
jgi:polysaccharide chain length determinant protein (PEP-CTERM system associated)